MSTLKNIVWPSKSLWVLAAGLLFTGGVAAQDASSLSAGIRSSSGIRPQPLPRDTTDKNYRAWQAIGLLPSSPPLPLRRPLKIAIIDDGFDLDNPVWAAHIAHNTAEIPGNNIDDDHNGKTDDYEGWDFGDNDEDVRPARGMVNKESHGTRVLGVFWQVLQRMTRSDLSGISLLLIKAVSDVKMNNYLKEGYNGIDYAIEQKADIIICSWSGPMIAPEEKAILEKARSKGIMIIAAAGNFYAMQPQYPGAVPSVINVAAIDKEGRKLHTSNYGVFVDISAPGDSLATFDPYKTTADATISATSAAAPVVGAIVTALRAAYPDLSPEAIERLLKNTATPLEDRNPLYAGNLGAGMVNVAAIRAALDSPAANPMVFHQSKAFIDLQEAGRQEPIRVVPAGKYKDIKFLLQSASLSPAALPDLRVSVFSGGQQKDTIIRRERLKYPFFAKGDSVHIYSLADRRPAPPLPSPGSMAAVHGSGLSGRQPVHAGSLTTQRRVHIYGEAWWYYEVTTIDSSTMYCGGEPTSITDGEGIIEDGSGDHDYTGRNDCKWQITAPPGKKIRLNFEAFDTEPTIDQVYIFNGNSTKDPILAIFSGHAIPPAIKSWGNTVLIWFLTSEENNFQGWKLHYKTVD